jgi:hypothetical protein
MNKPVWRLILVFGVGPVIVFSVMPSLAMVLLYYIVAVGLMM